MSYIPPAQFAFNPPPPPITAPPPKSNMGKMILIGLLVFFVLAIVGTIIGLSVWYFWPASEDENTENNNNDTTTDPCDLNSNERSCDVYNVAELNGTKYVCPENYTLIDGYKPGGLKGPVCHMNNGAQNTPKTCDTFKDPGCDFRKYDVPCMGLWPEDKYKGTSYYSKWLVVNAMPASEVCGK